MINLHTHTCYSDGSGRPEEYVEEALRQGLTAIGFSDHSPLPFENTFALKEEKTREYCESIISLKEKYKSPEIFLGMEVDFVPGMGHTPDWFRENYPLDYIIGSVHLVRNPDREELWFIDGPVRQTYDDGLQKVFGGDARLGVRTYFRQVNEMISRYRPEITGHLDKIRMHNKGRFFSEDDPFYLGLVDETLRLVKEAGSVVEVNTRGIYKNRSATTFPDPLILDRIRDLGIPVTLSSDAHRPAEVGCRLSWAAAMLLDLGFRSQWELSADGWREVPLDHMPGVMSSM